jgi:hypothetical protein
MASLFDLFNPTFFLFLAILLLVTALLDVYFESKMREQNHKIASMLSLVSSLAEEFNMISHELKQHATKGGASIPVFYPLNNLENPLNSANNNLINVSDDSGDEDEDDDDENEDVDDEDDEVNQDNEDQDNEDQDNEDDIDEDSEYNDDEYTYGYEEADIDDEIKSRDSDDVSVNKAYNNDNNSLASNNSIDIKINFSKNSDVKILKFDEDVTDLNLNIGDLDSIEVTNSDVIFDLVNEDFGNDNLKNEEKEQKILLSADVLEINENKLNEINAELKTININLEENIENHDYKKFSINKLRNIVVEKGLSTDASKLKKNEILKLLGAE